MKTVKCIACGQKRKINPKSWCNICTCEKKVHATDGAYELHIRSNGRKLHIDDLDYCNPMTTVILDFETKELFIWNLDRVEEIGKQYQASFKNIGLPVPALDLYILNDTSHVIKIIELESLV